MRQSAIQKKSRVAPHSKVSSVMPAPSLGQSIKDGIGLGIGSAIGHRIVSSIFGAPTVSVAAQHVPTAFEKCIVENRDDVALCAHLAEKPDAK